MIEKIKELRQLTGVSVVLCKKLLVENNGDIEAARKQLRSMGAETNTTQDTEHGIIECYVHPGNRIVAVVEVKCETDFVAKTKELRDFAKNVAMQVAAMSPKYINREDYWAIKEKDENFKNFNEWCSQVCLLEQPYIRDHSLTIKDLLSELLLKVGETCRITRILRWEVGV